MTSPQSDLSTKALELDVARLRARLQVVEDGKMKMKQEIDSLKKENEDLQVNLLVEMSGEGRSTDRAAEEELQRHKEDHRKLQAKFEAYTR